MKDRSSLRATTAEDRLEEGRLATMRIIEMILDEDWTGMLDAVAAYGHEAPRGALG